MIELFDIHSDVRHVSAIRIVEIGKFYYRFNSYAVVDFNGYTKKMYSHSTAFELAQTVKNALSGKKSPPEDSVKAQQRFGAFGSGHGDE